MSGTCEAKNSGNGKDCPRDAKKELKGKNFCTQHFKIEEKKIKSDAFLKGDLAPKATETTAVKKSTVKKGGAASKKDVPKKDASKEKEEASASSGVKPPKKENGTCSSERANNKGPCPYKASYTCSDSCHCGGNPMCGSHWNKDHPNAKSASGEKKTRKEVPEDDRCEHDTKAGGTCKNRAYGTDSDGLRSCAQAHGGPKKETTSAATSGGSAAPSGPFVGCDLIAVLSAITDFVEHHVENTCEKCDPEGVKDCPMWTSIDWLRGYFNLYRDNVPSIDDVMAYFVNVNSTKNGEEFNVVYDHTMIFYLRELLTDANIEWIYKRFRQYSRQEGVEASTISAIWQIVAEDMGIEIGLIDSSSSSSTSGKPIVSSKKRRNVQNIMNIAREELEEEEAKPTEDDAETEEEKPESMDVGDDAKDDAGDDEDIDIDVGGFE